MNRALLATRPADEARIRTYRDDLAQAMREDHEAIAPEPARPPVTVAVVFLAAAIVFAAILGAWL